MIETQLNKAYELKPMWTTDRKYLTTISKSQYVPSNSIENMQRHKNNYSAEKERKAICYVKVWKVFIFLSTQIGADFYKNRAVSRKTAPTIVEKKIRTAMIKSGFDPIPEFDYPGYDKIKTLWIQGFEQTTILLAKYNVTKYV